MQKESQPSASFKRFLPAAVGTAASSASVPRVGWRKSHLSTLNPTWIPTTSPVGPKMASGCPGCKPLPICPRRWFRLHEQLFLTKRLPVGGSAEQSECLHGSAEAYILVCRMAAFINAILPAAQIPGTGAGCASATARFSQRTTSSSKVRGHRRPLGSTCCLSLQHPFLLPRLASSEALPALLLAAVSSSRCCSQTCLPSALNTVQPELSTCELSGTRFGPRTWIPSRALVQGTSRLKTSFWQTG